MAKTTREIIVEPLNKKHDRDTFSCGVEALDRYLAQYASQDMAKHAAVTYVSLGDKKETISGYYTLAATSILLDIIPPDAGKKLPRYPNVPAILLGRLAVDLKYRKRGYGEYLLLDALFRAYQSSRSIGAAIVIVEAKDDRAKRFYEQYDFVSLVDSDNKLFLGMKAIAKLA